MDSIKKNSYRYIVGSMIAIAGLFILQRYNYLLFHSFAELFSIIIAGTLFLIMWNSRKYMENKVLVFISIGYLFIAFLDLLHTLSYQGMAIFTDYDFYANQVWIAARYLESFTLLVAFAWPEGVNHLIRRVRTLGVVMIYFVITTVLTAFIFVWKVFPICYLANQGQTEFKIISEYLICLVLVAGIIFLWKNRKDFDEKVYKFLIASMILTIFQELSFTLYTDNYGITNMVGHYLKILSFYLIYQAIVRTGIEEPYNLIFRELAINEVNLKEAKNAAEAANNMKSSFLANMSHEIRTPLNSVMGFTKLLLYEEKEPEKMEKLEIISNAGSHLQSLVDNILEFSKIEAGMIKIENRRFSLHKLIENLKKMFVLKSQERNLFLEVQVDPGVPNVIVGDEHRIMQVLVNLTGNAFKFTEFGGVSIHVSYLEGDLEIGVKDTGIGIPKEKFETIFSPFEQVDSSYARRYGGTGLGLSITRNLMELMGGKIRLESSTRGSEFFVTLPVEIGEFQIQDFLESNLINTGHNQSVILVVDRNAATNMEHVANLGQKFSDIGISMKVLTRDDKTKDRIVGSEASLVLLLDNQDNLDMKRLAADLEQDFRTSFLPIIHLHGCSAEEIRFQANPNAFKYGRSSIDVGFYSFVREVLQGQENFGEEMMKGWLESAQSEMGTHQILLEYLNDIVVRAKAVENALVKQGLEDIRSLTHSLKGGTGTLRMKEIYSKLCDMEAELSKSEPDLERLRTSFSTVREVLAMIPQKYIAMERIQAERPKLATSEVKILVVDDNIENRKLIGHFLSRLNYQYREADNGEVALEKLNNESFDMILLDSQMPVMDGIATLKRIREDLKLKELYIIMQSASAFEENIRGYFMAGCNDYISKPIDLSVLQSKIEEYLARQGA